MSHQATTWAWSLKLGDATRKLVLLKYANHAHEDGRNAWCKPKTVAEFAECSERTAQRHLGWILAEGYMREGDQEAYVWPKGYTGPRDPRYTPIVYDLAMDDETRLEWKRLAAAGGNARRDRHVVGGGVRRIGRGDDLTPQENDEEKSQVDTGDNLTPLSGSGLRGDKRSPSEVTNDHGPEHESEVTPVSPKQPSFTTISEQPSGCPADVVDFPTQDQDGDADGTLPGMPAKPHRPTANPKTPDPLIVQATALCSTWWNALPKKPLGRDTFRNVVLIVADALRKQDWTPDEISAGLKACGPAVTVNSLNNALARLGQQPAPNGRSATDSIRNLQERKRAHQARQAAAQRHEAQA